MFIVTINTWKCEGDYDRRISNLSRHLSVLEPDLLFLQEVFVAPEIDVDTGRRLSYALPGHHYFPVAARYKTRQYQGRDVASVSGLSLFARGEMLHSSVIQLPGLPEDPDRVAQLVRMKIGDSVLQVVNLHLTHIRNQNAHKVKQLESILAHLEPGLPTIIGGDFNARPESEVMDFVRSSFDELVVCPEPTGPGGNVIDYIAWRDLDHRGFQCEPLFDGKSTPRVSDHLGVGVHLDLIDEQSRGRSGRATGTDDAGSTYRFA